MKKIIFLLICTVVTSSRAMGQKSLPQLQISENGRFFETAPGKPFFWLGDTGWLLWVKCKREEVVQYLNTRKAQGFNVIQVMVLHELKHACNAYGDSALVNWDVSKPLVTSGNRFSDKTEYDYWDHVEFVIQQASIRGMYVAMVPVWGSNVKEGLVSEKQALAYGAFLGKRFHQFTNIVWLNGGDLRGSEFRSVWEALGTSIKNYNPAALMSFHPRGRYSSSEWFHDSKWLDFNMVQSGHRNYSQDTLSSDKYHYGEDNWKYIIDDYTKNPIKPTLDGEPSYEDIPQGLHDYKMPVWKATDIRRYSYWSVFAGGAGVSYGHNAVMQFYHPGDADANYNVHQHWASVLQSEGARQLVHLKKLILSCDYYSRVPAPELLAENKGIRYSYQLATRGKNFAMVYVYDGKAIVLNMDKLDFVPNSVFWFNPRTGSSVAIKQNKLPAGAAFQPPGKPAIGNDWVLVLKQTN